MKLKEIDLSKTKQDHEFSYHPDFKCDGTQYLAKWRDRFMAGTMCKVWYGYSFHPFWGQPLQYDKPGTNSSSWERLWEIIDDTT